MTVQLVISGVERKSILYILLGLAIILGTYYR